MYVAVVVVLDLLLGGDAAGMGRPVPRSEEVEPNDDEGERSMGYLYLAKLSPLRRGPSQLRLIGRPLNKKSSVLSSPLSDATSWHHRQARRGLLYFH